MPTLPFEPLIHSLLDGNGLLSLRVLQGGAQDHATNTGESSSHVNNAHTDQERNSGFFRMSRLPHPTRGLIAKPVFGMPR
jgi:hypothetical protein